MKYHSTRSNNNLSSKEAILLGISPDSGLFVPKEFPKIGDLNHLTDMKYQDIAYYILGKYLTDFTPEELKYCVEEAYKKFSIAEVVKVKEIPLEDHPNEYYLELFHGETSAFKDLALSILPYFMEVSLKDAKDYENILILTATSGDTGKAALEGFKNNNNIKISVMYPKDGVSDTQKLQMQTQEGDNVQVLALDGNFDDCQNKVKELFTDPDFMNYAKDNGYYLSSANSINIGRLLPQIVYYVYTYVELLRNGKIADDERINVVVPTGNFGNILACLFAKKMGLPIGDIICASNDNHILTDFFETGIYDTNRDFILTNSPSMDILISSNLERFLYYLLDSKEEVNRLYEDLKNEKKFSIPVEEFDKVPFLKAYHSTEEEVLETIQKVYEKDGYLIDPHTAVAKSSYDKYLKDHENTRKTVLVSTASPYKFTQAIVESLDLEDSDDLLEEIYKLTKTEIPENIKNLKNLEIRFNKETDFSEVEDLIKEFIHEEN